MWQAERPTPIQDNQLKTNEREEVRVSIDEEEIEKHQKRKTDDSRKASGHKDRRREANH